MPANKVIYGNKILIDLTSDTISEDTLIWGRTAHKADGTIIMGTAFAGYPNEWSFYDVLQDSAGRNIMDSSSNIVKGQIVYRKS